VVNEQTVVGLAKPHAVAQLAAELSSCVTDVVLITETHFKVRHTDSVITIPNYIPTLYSAVIDLAVKEVEYSTLRQINHRINYMDLCGKPIVRNALGAYWSKHVCCDVFYHPPKPLYRPAALIDYIETCIEKLNQDYRAAFIVLAGDINELSNEDMIERIQD